MKLPCVTVTGPAEDGEMEGPVGLGSDSVPGLFTFAAAGAGDVGKGDRGDGGGEKRRAKWGNGGKFSDKGAILAASAGPAVVERWPRRRWLRRTSTPGVDRRKVAASWAQEE